MFEPVTENADYRDVSSEPNRYGRDAPSLIERGRNAPSFETLDKIAKRLRITVTDLFTFDRNSRWGPT
jgi:transcriptional regulator with XRE-family HTH domain